MNPERVDVGAGALEADRIGEVIIVAPCDQPGGGVFALGSLFFGLGELMGDRG